MTQMRHGLVKGLYYLLVELQVYIIVSSYIPLVFSSCYHTCSYSPVLQLDTVVLSDTDE